MMMDGKGCGLIVGGLSALGLFIGLLLFWFGLVPWWGVLIGAALPVALAALLGVYLIAQWMAGGSH